MEGTDRELHPDTQTMEGIERGQWKALIESYILTHRQWKALREGNGRH